MHDARQPVPVQGGLLRGEVPQEVRKSIDSTSKIIAVRLGKWFPVLAFLYFYIFHPVIQINPPMAAHRSSPGPLVL